MRFAYVKDNRAHIGEAQSPTHIYAAVSPLAESGQIRNVYINIRDSKWKIVGANEIIEGAKAERTIVTV